MSSELPPELWLRIADFIPDEALYRLSSVNHLFLDSSEDRKYKDLVLDDDQPQVLMQKLRKLRSVSYLFAPSGEWLTEQFLSLQR